MFLQYLKNTGTRRLILMVIGNIFLGMGVSIFKFSGMGNDPFNGMLMALANITSIAYPVLMILLNIFLFILELVFGRTFIGAGTIVNACFLGYITTFFYTIIQMLFGEPSELWQRIIIVCIGVIITSFGVSLYQTADAGIAPYDSLSLITSKRWPNIPYFWHRMATDAVCALVCYLAGGIIGLGTLLCAFCLGPIVHFFTEHISKKFLN